MSTPAGRPYRLYRRRAELLSAAKLLFAERGYDATSMGAIADRVGVTKAALYYYLPSKAELLRAVTRPNRAALLSVVDSAMSTGAPAVDRLDRLLRDLTVLVADDPPGFALIWRAHGATASDGQVSTCRDTLFRCLLDLVEQAATEGGIRGDLDPRIAAQLLLWAMAPPTGPNGRAIACDCPHTLADILLAGLTEDRNQQG